MEGTDNKYEYYQYFKELGFPIYVRFDPVQFDASLSLCLHSNKFSKIEERDLVKMQEDLQIRKQAIVLTIKEASPSIANFIEAGAESDFYSKESITPRSGYKLYRYQDLGVLLYSFAFNDWELGCFNDFGEEQNTIGYRIMLNRFLSLAFSLNKIVGFWGVQVDEGVVIQNMQDSEGECVFFDLNKNQVFGLDGVRKVRSRFQILRLDSTLHHKNITMSGEELLGYLYRQCSFFDYSGVSAPVRQMILNLSKKVRGILHPKESFRPKENNL